MPTTDPIESHLTREEIYRLPHPPGPHRPPWRGEVPVAVQQLTRAIAGVIGASSAGFRFALTVQFAPQGLRSAEIASFELADAAVVQRVRTCLDRLVVASASAPTEGFELWFLVSRSITYVDAECVSRVETLCQRLGAQCPSFRERWARYAGSPGFDPKSLYGAEGQLVEHAASLLTEGREHELVAPFAALQDLAEAEPAWALELRRSVLARLVATLDAPDLTESPLAAVLPPAMRPLWDAMWDERGRSGSHDPYY